MQSQSINIMVTLTDDQAWQYAQFLKRVSFNEYRNNASNDDEAYLMRAAGQLIREALASQGYAPR